MTDICEAFKDIIAQGEIEKVLFDCEKRQIYIETCTGEGYYFTVSKVRKNE